MTIIYGVRLEIEKLRMIGEKMGKDILQGGGLGFGLVVTLHNETMQNFSIHIRLEIIFFFCIVQTVFTITYLIITEPGKKTRMIQTGINFHQCQLRDLEAWV